MGPAWQQYAVAILHQTHTLSAPGGAGRHNTGSHLCETPHCLLSCRRFHKSQTQNLKFVCYSATNTAVSMSNLKLAATETRHLQCVWASGPSVEVGYSLYKGSQGGQVLCLVHLCHDWVSSPKTELPPCETASALDRLQLDLFWGPMSGYCTQLRLASGAHSSRLSSAAMA